MPSKHALLTLLATLVSYVVLGYLLLGPRTPPAPGNPLVELLPHAIAGVNAANIAVILSGYTAIRRKRVRRHKILMTASFILIASFLLMYVTRLYLGGVKEFTGPAIIRNFVYLPALTIHLGLSIVSVPLVLYNVLTGWTLDVGIVGKTRHRAVGRWAVRAWTVSLALGVLVYLLLNYY
jgi:putative membrane protein